MADVNKDEVTHVGCSAIVRSRDFIYLRVPEMCCKIITLLTQLQGYYLVHFEMWNNETVVWNMVFRVGHSSR